MNKERGVALIYEFIDQSTLVKDGLEPFPISLRGINWIKFLTQHNIRDQKIDDSLYAQYMILLDNLEYHLLGNHLLENGFSLFFAAYYFQDKKFYVKAKEILLAELEEQILDDGAHFELSPMYHQIILFRVLDCLNLLQNNQWMVDSRLLIEFLVAKAVKMLGWLNAITFENGEIPLFNDSTYDIAPTTEQLNYYAKLLGIDHQPSTVNPQLNESGYRKITKQNYEMTIDVGPIGPDYIPGHAHADTFNFELQINGKPLIVDTGLSTYETNARRTEERATSAHNTVEILDSNSSEVWAGFRVADRAYVTIEQESDNRIVASHDGYQKKFGIIHTREWQFEEDKIVIKDTLNKPVKAVVRLHFHPSVTEEMIHERIQNSKFKIQNYKYAPEFNKLVDAKVVEIEFEKELEIEIRL
ncbi:heparinase II/III domain-containing protein [Sulfurovum sp. ST-21]|nr:alginate lyase family protein [Sulfurovum indicum]